MASYQQITIVGNVGNDPELKYTQGGVGVCNFSVAVTEKWNDNEKTTWFRVAAWKKLAETCEQYVYRGMQVMVVGSIDASAYTNNAGEPAASIELNAFKVVFLGKREDEQHPDGMGAPEASGINPMHEGDIPF